MPPTPLACDLQPLAHSREHLEKLGPIEPRMGKAPG